MPIRYLRWHIKNPKITVNSQMYFDQTTSKRFDLNYLCTKYFSQNYGDKSRIPKVSFEGE